MEHSFIHKFSMFTQYRILESEESCISFLQQHEIIPKKEDKPPLCPECSSSMRVHPNKSTKLGWGWECKNSRLCNRSISSLKDTLFEKMLTPLRDVMAFIFCLILNIKLTDMHEELVCWRALRSERPISKGTTRYLSNILAEAATTALTKNGEEVLGPLDTIFDKYRERRLNFHVSYDGKLHQFLMDIKAVYPGYLKTTPNPQ